MSPHQTSRPVVFAAMSKRTFFMREHIIRFILEQDYTPTCAFMMYSYFLLDTVERKQLIDANNDLIKRSDQLWVFGEVSTGVCEEIKLAKLLNQPIRYFSIEPCINGIKEITPEKVEFENDVDWDINNLTD